MGDFTGVVLVLVLLFIIVRLGMLKFGATAIETSQKVAEVHMEAWAKEAERKAKRNLGKTAEKIMDDSIVYGSRKTVDAAWKKREAAMLQAIDEA